MPYYSVKTTASYEVPVAEMITDKSENVYAGLVAKGMRGYIILEAENPNVIERVLSEVPNAIKLLEGEASSTEVMDFLEPASDTENIAEGDIVEVKEGPYSGEKAQISTVNEGKGQVTLKLIEATVPIPVTLNASQVRRLESDERDA